MNQFTLQPSSGCGCETEFGSSSGCGCETEFDLPMAQSSGYKIPSVTFGDLTQLFVDRRDVKFWQAEGPQHNHLYWVRAMLSDEVEPSPLRQASGAVRLPQSEADYLRFAQARAQAYGFLARAFEYPTDTFLADITSPAYVETIATAFGQLADNDNTQEGLTLWRQVARAKGSEAVVGKFGLSPLRGAYTRIIYDSNLPFIPPYESVYYNQRHVMGKRAEAVIDFYKQAGLGVDGNEMPDHIALECEFVALLAGREATAWQAGQPEEAQQNRQLGVRFLKSHILSWGGKFCADLLALARVDFYRAVAHLGAGLFNDELIRMNGREI